MADLKDCLLNAKNGSIYESGKKPERETIRCPEMVFAGQAVARPTMSVGDCLRRMEVFNECTERCEIADQLRKVKPKR